MRFFTEHLLCDGLVGSCEAPAKGGRGGGDSLDGGCPGDPQWPRLLRAEAMVEKELGLFPDKQGEQLEGGHGAGVATASPTDLTLTLFLKYSGRVRIKIEQGSKD